MEVALLDGERPDVLRRPSTGRGLFVGEAKHSEGPSDMRSVTRLDRYLEWLLPVERTGGLAVLAVAHVNGLDAAWRARLDWLRVGHDTAGHVWSAPATVGTVVSVLVLGLSVRKGKQDAERTRRSVA